MNRPDRWVSISADYVRPRPPGASDAWHDEAALRGHVGSQVLREVAEVVPPEDVAEALRIAPGDRAIVRRRLVLLDQQPIEVADSFYPTAIARGTALAEFRKIRGGAVTLLTELGHAPRRVIEDVSTRLPNVEERELLRLEDNQPVLVLFRVAVGADDRPIEATVMIVADGRRLRYELNV